MRFSEAIRRYPLRTYLVFAFAISWTLWIPWALGDEGPVSQVLFVLGGFGPLAASLLVTRIGSGRRSGWFRGLWTWRVPWRLYAYALGLPALLVGLVNVELAVTGHDLDLSLLPSRLAGYAGTFAFVASLGGGLEEPGWRGFALPRFEQRYGPVIATLLLGLAWGVWHIPAYRTPLAFAVPLVLAFFYTWLYNRAGSVLLCVLLHASFTPAIDQLVLAPDSVATDTAIFATLVMAAVVLTAVTRGRLGYSLPRDAAETPRPDVQGQTLSTSPGEGGRLVTSSR